LRIVHVLTESKGGGGAYALTLAHAVASNGDEPEFVAPERFSDDFPTTPLWARAPTAMGVLRRADIVHCHGIRAGLVARLLLSPATILTTHGLHALRSSTGAKRVLASRLTRSVLRSAGHVVCVSDSEREDSLRLAPGLQSRVRVIPNGVPPVPLPSQDDKRAARERLRLPVDAPVLLFLGGVRYQKNPLLAADAVERARRRVPELVLLVAGAGPELPELRKREREWLRVLGHREDGDELLVAADAVLNTSRWEGLSLALLEGLWRGRPVIVTDAPGNGDAAGDAGLVVSQSAGAVADAIVELFETPALYDELSRKARGRAEALFDERRMIEQTLRLYAEVTGGDGGN
jgi:glycosyltransferase involved in cell wall biosynthesis